MTCTERPLRAAWLLALCCAPALPLRADEIRADRHYTGVIVRKFDGEFVIFELPGGEAKARKLDELEAMFVDSVPGLEAFNRAEGFFERQAYDRAAEQYPSALSRSRGFWRLLIEARFLLACDRSGQLDRATETFIRLGPQLGGKAAGLRPRHIERAGAEQRRAALALLDRAVPDTANRDVRWQYEALRLGILEHVDLPRAARLAGDMLERLDREPGGLSRWPVRLAVLRVQARVEQWRDVLPALEQGIAEAPQGLLPELLYLKGRALFSLASGREDYLSAGLTLMRVVVHFPEAEYAAPAMYWTARAHELIERPTQAIELYRECLTLPGADPDLRVQVDAALQRLGVDR